VSGREPVVPARMARMSIEQVAASLRRTARVIDTLQWWLSGRWGESVLRHLGRRYQLLMVRAGQMLDVATPPSGPPEFAGLVLDVDSECLLAAGLHYAGFDPLGPGTRAGAP
jgi:hypothetical protein